MIKIVRFYTLNDPETNEVRYVGKTIRPLEKRLSQHISDANKGKGKCYRNNWIKSVLNKNLIPVIELIYESEETEETWQEKEKFMIYCYKKQGCKLVNSTEGGNGHHGKTDINKTRKFKNPETVKKMSESAKGRKWSNEMIEFFKKDYLKRKRYNQINNKLCKPVLKCDENEECIEEYFSIAEAARLNGLNTFYLSQRIRGTHEKSFYKGYFWKFK